MDSIKKKIYISLCALIVVLVVSVCAIVAVFASTNATVTSSINVSYTAIHVKATISASYQVKGSSSQSFSPASITFTGSESTNNVDNVKSFSSVSINLTDTKDYVDFVYTITNSSSALSPITVALASDPEVANDNIVYTYSAVVDGASVSNPSYSNLVASLAAGKSATVTIRMQIEDLDYNASVSGSLAFILSPVSQ